MKLDVKSVSAGYGGKLVLDGVDLTVPEGGILTLVGANGSGKSTLLKVIGRLLEPRAGEIVLDGRAIRSYGTTELARKMAILPQLHHAAGEITVGELVGYGRFPHRRGFGQLSADDHAVIDETLKLTRLEPFRNRPVGTLSGGERQRAWIAMLVAQDSRCLLLDEPTSALDIAHQVDVLALVHRLSQERGLTVIAVLHDINMAARYCDYLVALRGGEMIAQGTPAEIMRGETLEMIYGIPMGILPHPAGAAPVSFVY